MVRGVDSQEDIAANGLRRAHEGVIPHHLFYYWQQHIKCCAFSFLAICPDKSKMVFNYFTRNGQANSGAGVRSFTMKPFKHFEDLFRVLLLETNAVVADTNKMKRLFFQ